MDQPAPEASRYAFILRSDKRPSLSLPGLNIPRPIKIAVVIILLVMLLFGLLLAFGGKSSPLVQVAARQKEIARVSVSALASAQGQNVKDLASTVDSIFSSQQNQSAKALGVSSNSSKLNLYYSKATDTQLQSATENNTFDTVYLQILKAQLQAYSEAILSTSKQLPSDSPNQALLAADYKDTQALLGDPTFTNL